MRSVPEQPQAQALAQVQEVCVLECVPAVRPRRLTVYPWTCVHGLLCMCLCVCGNMATHAHVCVRICVWLHVQQEEEPAPSSPVATAPAGLPAASPPVEAPIPSDVTVPDESEVPGVDERTRAAQQSYLDACKAHGSMPISKCVYVRASVGCEYGMCACAQNVWPVVWVSVRACVRMCSYVCICLSLAG